MRRTILARALRALPFIAVAVAVAGCRGVTRSPPSTPATPAVRPRPPTAPHAWVELGETPALPFTYDGSDGSLSVSQRALAARYFAYVEERTENAPAVRFEALPQHWFPALTFVHVHGSTHGGHEELRNLTIGIDADGRGRIVATVQDADEYGGGQTIRGLRLCSDDAWTVCEDVTPQLVAALRAEIARSSLGPLVPELLRVMVPIVGAATEGRLVRSSADLPPGELRWSTEPVPSPGPPTFAAHAGGPHVEGLVVAPRTLGGDWIYHFELDLLDSLALSLRLAGQRVVHTE